MTKTPVHPPAQVGALLAELLEALSASSDTVSRLAALAGQKLSALRQADADALHRCAQVEGRLVAALTQLIRQRQAVLARLAQALHAPPLAQRPISELAARLDPPQASLLLAAAQRLAMLGGELQRKNALTARAARGLQEHIHAALAALQAEPTPDVTYRASGQRDRQSAGSKWIDAVG